MAAVGTTELVLVIRAVNEIGPIVAAASDQLSQISGVVQQVDQAASQVAGAATVEIATSAGGALQDSATTIAGALSDIESGARSMDEVINTALGPDINELVGFLGQVAEGFQAWRAEQPEVIGGLAKFGIIAGVAGTGALGFLDMVGGAAKGLTVLKDRLASAGPLLASMGPMFGSITGFGRGLIPVLVGLGRSLMFLALSPIGMVVIAIAALIAIGILVWKNWDTIREKAITIFTAIKNFIVEKLTALKEFFVTKWEEIRSVVVNAVQNALDWLGENWPLILAIFTGPFGLIVLAVVEFKDEILGAFQAVINKIGEFFAMLGDLPGKIKNAVKDVPVLGGIAGALGNVFGFAEGAILRRPVITLAEREPEVIAPISALSRMLPGMSGSPSVTIINRGTIVHDQEFVDLLARAYHTAQRQGRVP